MRIKREQYDKEKCMVYKPVKRNQLSNTFENNEIHPSLALNKEMGET